jgi:hypothetical protein
VACLRARVADLKKRIRLARQELNWKSAFITPKLRVVLDLRKPLKKARTK